MGIIAKQSIKGSIWSYLGVALGFLNLGVLSQRFFSTEQVGLTQVLISFATIFSQVGTLGMGNVAMKLFPQFRNESNKHNGFIGLSIVVSLIGFLLMSLIIFSFESFFVHSKSVGSSLFSEHYYFTYPLIFFILFFSIFDSYNRMLFNAVMGTFLREFLLRIINTGLIVLFILKIITFDGYILLYVFSQSVPTIFLTLSLWKRKMLTLKFNFKILTPLLRKEVFDVAVFGIIAGLSGMVIQHVDKIMLNRLINLDASGIYGVTFFFGSLIIISQRAISNISTTVISEAWKTNDIKIIESIYIKSSINQFIIGVLIFIGIWGNIDNVFQILRPEYLAGKWVIFFISLSNLVTVISGGSIYILSTSKYFRYHMWFMAMLIILVILTNLFLIPIWGLTGAAVASFISMLIYTGITILFLYLKFKIHPLKYNHIVILIIGIITYFFSQVIGPMSSFIFDIILRSIFIVIVFGLLIIMFKSSEDINAILRKYWSKWVR